MALETVDYIFQIKEIFPGALYRLAGKVFEVVSSFSQKLSPFGIKVNYIDLAGDKLVVNVTREVPETSASVLPLIAVIALSILVPLGIIVISLTVLGVVKYLGKKDALDYCEKHNLPPEQCIKVVNAIAPSSDIDWDLYIKIALGVGAFVGGAFLINAFWPRKG